MLAAKKKLQDMSIPLSSRQTATGIPHPDILEPPQKAHPTFRLAPPPGGRRFLSRRDGVMDEVLGLAELGRPAAAGGDGAEGRGRKEGAGHLKGATA